MSLLLSMLAALDSLRANKLRSALTVLGVVIGVASVIALVSLGRGYQDAVSEQLSGVGVNQLTVFGYADQNVRNPQPLTLEDAQAIAAQLAGRGVRRVAAYVSGGGEISYGSKSASASFYGVTPEFDEVSNFTLAEGSFITEEHIAGQSSVAVIGPRLARKLFGRERGLTGEIIRVEGQPYRIVGVLETKGLASLTMASPDEGLFVPLSTSKQRLMPRNARNQVDAILIDVSSPDVVKRTAEDIKQVLRVRHRTQVGLDDFTVFVAVDLLESFNQVMSVLTVFLGGVAGISLLVGGIGIMNIMLVSVTERTREIGLRKALGATREDILAQFLIEAATLSLAGGLLGILTGWLIGLVVSLFAAQAGSQIDVKIGLDAILLAVVFSSAVGIFFGFYPANRAARMQPVEALRSE